MARNPPDRRDSNRERKRQKQHIESDGETGAFFWKPPPADVPPLAALPSATTTTMIPTPHPMPSSMVRRNMTSMVNDHPFANDHLSRSSVLANEAVLRAAAGAAEDEEPPVVLPVAALPSATTNDNPVPDGVPSAVRRNILVSIVFQRNLTILVSFSILFACQHSPTDPARHRHPGYDLYQRDLQSKWTLRDSETKDDSFAAIRSATRAKAEATSKLVEVPRAQQAALHGLSSKRVKDRSALEDRARFELRWTPPDTTTRQVQKAVTTLVEVTTAPQDDVRDLSNRFKDLEQAYSAVKAEHETLSKQVQPMALEGLRKAWLEEGYAIDDRIRSPYMVFVGGSRFKTKVKLQAESGSLICLGHILRDECGGSCNRPHGPYTLQDIKMVAEFGGLEIPCFYPPARQLLLAPDRDSGVAKLVHSAKLRPSKPDPPSEGSGGASALTGGTNSTGNGSTISLLTAAKLRPSKPDPPSEGSGGASALTGGTNSTGNGSTTTLLTAEQAHQAFRAKWKESGMQISDMKSRLTKRVKINDKWEVHQETLVAYTKNESKSKNEPKKIICLEYFLDGNCSGNCTKFHGPYHLRDVEKFSRVTRIPIDCLPANDVERNTASIDDDSKIKSIAQPAVESPPRKAPPSKLDPPSPSNGARDSISMEDDSKINNLAQPASRTTMFYKFRRILRKKWAKCQMSITDPKSPFMVETEAGGKKKQLVGLEKESGGLICLFNILKGPGSCDGTCGKPHGSFTLDDIKKVAKAGELDIGY
jgi:hypothetical protein